MTNLLPPARTAVFYVGSDGVPVFTRVWYRYFETVLAALGGSGSALSVTPEDVLQYLPAIVPFDPATLPPQFEPATGMLDAMSETLKALDAASVSLPRGDASEVYELRKQVDALQFQLSNLLALRSEVFELRKTVHGLQCGVMA